MFRDEANFFQVWMTAYFSTKESGDSHLARGKRERPCVRLFSVAYRNRAIMPTSLQWEEHWRCGFYEWNDTIPFRQREPSDWLRGLMESGIFCRPPYLKPDTNASDSYVPALTLPCGRKRWHNKQRYFFLERVSDRHRKHLPRSKLIQHLAPAKRFCKDRLFSRQLEVSVVHKMLLCEWPISALHIRTFSSCRCFVQRTLFCGFIALRRTVVG